MLATVAASASAAPPWVPPRDISGPNEAITFPEVAVSAGGTALAIWPRVSGGERIIEAAERQPGEDWQEPQLLSDPAGEENPEDAHVVLDDMGNAVAIWSAGMAIRTALRPAGGEWSDAEDLSTEGWGKMPGLAIGAGGEALAVWTAFDGADEAVWAAALAPGGEWSEPEVISAAGEAGWNPAVAVDGAGIAVAVWEQIDIGDNFVRSAVRSPGGEWSAPDDVSVAGEEAGSPRVAISPAGRAVAAWTDSTGDSVTAAVRPAGSDWLAPEDVSTAGEITGVPELAIDADGEAFAIWSAPAGGGDRLLRAATLPAGGEWSASEPISDPVEEFQGYDLAASSVTGAIATWTRGDGSGYTVQAAVRSPGEDWSDPDDVSTPGEDSGLPDLGFDAAGNAVAIWGRDAGDHYLIQGSGYDFTEPELGAVQIPATGTVGEPVSFSASPFDFFWIEATSWSFGDGGSASGSSASHVYAAPGTYPVAVTTTDAGDRSATATATIEIVASPGPPPPPPPPPSNQFQIGKLTRNTSQGSAKLAITVPGPGTLQLGGQKLRFVQRSPGGAATQALPVRLKNGAMKTLRERGSLTVQARITFTPLGGTSLTRTKSVKLIRKAG